MNPYLELRNRYLPKDLKLIFILESPPVSKNFFYNPFTSTRETLFHTFMLTIFEKDFATKEQGLHAFAAAGYLVVDPIYEPVNKLPDALADRKILEHYPLFKKDLEQLMRKRDTPLILVKKNICLLLEDRLLNDGFTVLNQHVSIPFPIRYHADEFIQRVRLILVTQKLLP